VRDYEELYPHLVKGIEHSFSIYKEIEAKTTRIVGWRGSEQARTIVSECQVRYAKKNS